MCFYEYDVYDCIVCKEVMHTKPYLLLREPGATQFETIDKRCPTAQRLDMLAENCPFVKYNNFPRRIRLQPNQFCSKVCEGSYRRAHQKAKRREEAAGGQGGSWKTASHLDSGSDFNKYRRSPAHKRGRSPSPHSRWMYDGWEGKQEEGLVSLQDDGYSNYYYDPGESSCSSSTVPTKHRPQPSPPLEDFREVYEKAYGCVTVAPELGRWKRLGGKRFLQ
ncbi:hypothetical protein M406DRAFT_327097 [Cryphonectria parasitica EP155]|uniref:Uncharacterized protein n=1 Tax=Cryphonectria parasitica (strain ATCC 38755 / EP155) TaxID=660469 RepID=A0A9P5CSJ6_CRYP1|nr:uncharacterized protein M406DRAFT_327097 [Cryphonectria parasitica EP155]KAF3768677.1 hypothetical protein M406DRAFT_327097 [Cryphonectria parasitica EP155]